MKHFQTFWVIICNVAVGLVFMTGFNGVARAQTSSDSVIGPGGSAPSSTTAAPQNGPAIVAHTATTTEQGSGWLQDTVVKRLNHPVDQLSFRVTNKTNSAIKYDFSNGQKVEVVVTDANAKEVWTWSKSKVFPPLITHLVLRPGQSKSFDVVWDRRDDHGKPVAPGTYTATASLVTMARIVVSATSTMNAGRTLGDPTNVGMPTPTGQNRGADSSQLGSSEQSDISPPVSAKTTIVIAAGGQ